MSVFYYRGDLRADHPLFVDPRLRWEMKAQYADLEDIVSLCRPPLGSYIILFGAHQTGKTSLINRLGPELSESAYVVLVNLLFVDRKADLSSVFQSIGRELAKQLSPALIEDAQSIRDGADFRDFLCQVETNLPVVIALDEIGALHPEIALALSKSLRALHQSRHRPNSEPLTTYLFLLAGGIELYESVTASVTSPLRNISERFYLTDLSHTQSNDLLTRGLSQLRLDDKSIRTFSERIYHHARGQPYLTQRLGASVERALLEGDIKYSADLVDAAAAHLTVEDDAHILPIVKGLQAEGLWDAALELLEKPDNIPFSHFDDIAERLMLLGLIRNESGRCVVRNPIYEEIIRWKASTKPKETASVLQLEDIRPGREDAKAYEQCVFQILRRFFADQLSHPERESRTVDGTERRDIIFYNASAHGFWQMARERYGATNIVFECKNTEDVKLDDVNQLAEYLGRPLGNFGMIVSRMPPGKNLQRKAITAFNRNDKVVLFLSDVDLAEMARLHERGEDPTAVIEHKYVQLTRAVQ